jgi:hypothetical protein
MTLLCNLKSLNIAKINSFQDSQEYKLHLLIPPKQLTHEKVSIVGLFVYVG